MDTQKLNERRCVIYFPTDNDLLISVLEYSPSPISENECAEHFVVLSRQNGRIQDDTYPIVGSQ